MHSIMEIVTMGRPKKNGTYLNICIETPIYERLEALCEDAGQTKTVAVERALTAYLDDYEEKHLLMRLFNLNMRTFERLSRQKGRQFLCGAGNLR